MAEQQEARTQVSVLMEEKLREQLEVAARGSRRSLSGEIAWRLERSLECDRQIDTDPRDARAQASARLPCQDCLRGLSRYRRFGVRCHRTSGRRHHGDGVMLTAPSSAIVISLEPKQWQKGEFEAWRETASRGALADPCISHAAKSAF